jgi:nicotinate-nucleotide pyrophosphorylase (carboxylating)
MKNNDICNLIDRDFIKNILIEDAPSGDITSDVILDDSEVKAYIICKDNCILCGLEIVKSIFLYLDEKINIDNKFIDGDIIAKNNIVCKLSGNCRSILKGERTALNLLSYLSGISTNTSKYVEITKKYNVKLLDTRKTLPMYRNLAKYAVRVGGGNNHRLNLSDMFLIKDNHILISGGIEKCLNIISSKRNLFSFAKIEIEVQNIDEAILALKYYPDIIMLDNFSVSDAKNAINILKDKVKIEISGNINLTNIEEYAKLKPHFISVGSITHSVKAIDFSLDIESHS